MTKDEQEKHEMNKNELRRDFGEENEGTEGDRQAGGLACQKEMAVRPGVAWRSKKNSFDAGIRTLA
jgi:hypothetical protein